MWKGGTCVLRRMSSSGGVRLFSSGTGVLPSSSTGGVLLFGSAGGGVRFPCRGGKDRLSMAAGVTELKSAAPVGAGHEPLPFHSWGSAVLPWNGKNSSAPGREKRRTGEGVLLFRSEGGGVLP